MAMNSAVLELTRGFLAGPISEYPNMNVHLPGFARETFEAEFSLDDLLTAACRKSVKGSASYSIIQAHHLAQLHLKVNRVMGRLVDRFVSNCEERRDRRIFVFSPGRECRGYQTEIKLAPNSTVVLDVLARLVYPYIPRPLQELYHTHPHYLTPEDFFAECFIMCLVDDRRNRRHVPLRQWPVAITELDEYLSDDDSLQRLHDRLP